MLRRIANNGVLVMTEYAWVIELSSSSPPMFWCGLNKCSSEVYHAVRFSRAVDAEVVARTFNLAVRYRIAEKRFL